MKATGNVTVSRTLTLTLSLTDDEIEMFQNGCLALAEADAPTAAVYLKTHSGNLKSKTLFAAIRESIRRSMV